MDDWQGQSNQPLASHYLKSLYDSMIADCPVGPVCPEGKNGHFPFGIDILK
jgi:hypothetical protein